MYACRSIRRNGLRHGKGRAGQLPFWQLFSFRENYGRIKSAGQSEKPPQVDGCLRVEADEVERDCNW